jgi:hypothetical protein
MWNLGDNPLYKKFWPNGWVDKEEPDWWLILRVSSFAYNHDEERILYSQNIHFIALYVNHVGAQTTNFDGGSFGIW